MSISDLDKALAKSTGAKGVIVSLPLLDKLHDTKRLERKTVGTTIAGDPDYGKIIGDASDGEPSARVSTDVWVLKGTNTNVMPEDAAGEDLDADGPGSFKINP